MKWGVRKDRTKGTSKKSSLIGKKKTKEEKDAEEKSRVAKAKEKRRQEILRSPTQLYKHRNEFTQEEIDSAMKRMKWERELRQLSRDEMSRGKTYVDVFIGYGKTMSEAYNLYNSAAGKALRSALASNDKKKK